MNVDNYMDWQPLMVNEIAGSIVVFIILGLVVLLYIGAKMRFPNIITIMMMIVFMILMSSFIPTLMAIILVFVGILFSFLLNYMIGNK